MRERLRAADGFSLIELLTVMVVLSIILGVVVGSFTTAFTAQGRAFTKAQAEENARLALNRIRLDVHCATSVSTTPDGLVTLGEDSACPGLNGATSVQWCTKKYSDNRWRLHREIDGTCDGSGSTFMADYLVTEAEDVTVLNPWIRVACGSGRAEALGVQFDVNVTPSKPNNGYKLHDEIALRNLRC